MTAVRLEWPVRDERLRGARVPVDVRTPTLALLERAEMPGTVHLEPGTYVLTAKLPAGQELTRIVTVGGEPMAVPFTPEGPAREAVDYLKSAGERKAALGGTSAARRLRLEEGTRGKERPMAVGSPAPPGRLRGWRADPLAGQAKRVDLGLELVDRGGDVVEYRLGPSPELRWVQVLQPARPPVNIALPTSPQAGCRVVVRRLPGRYWVEAQIEHPAGNLLLGYQRNATPREEAITAERLLAGKFDDPIAAAVGAYSLLRFGELDRLHGWWPENLRRSFRWLPDGAAIRGEQLARQGEHEEALAAFLEAAGRGLPLFSDGLDFLYRRLKLYVAAADEVPAADLARCKALLARLHPVVGFVDFTQVVTTFTGLDPAHPDAEPLVGPPPAGGLDLAAEFGRPRRPPDRPEELRP